MRIPQTTQHSPSEIPSPDSYSSIVIPLPASETQPSSHN
ncbi:hypothetical protein A2U01_0119153, partial [Trifolium medium]|nr:hypothetical protein [Trifolium medium]